MSSFGKPLAGKRKTRGNKDDPREESQVFLELYSQFHEQLESMDDDDKAAFIERADEVQSGFGTVLKSGDCDEVSELFSDLHT